MRLHTSIAAILFSLPHALSQSCPSITLKTSYPAPVVAPGWEARLIAQGLTKPRSLLFDGNGGLLVVQQGVGIVHLNFTDRGGTCLEMAKKTVVAEEPTLNHGIALSADNKTLYASSASSLYSWSYDPQNFIADALRRTLVQGMSNSDHTTRTLLISSFSPSTIVISRGSGDNLDVNAQDITTGHSQVKAFNLTLLNANQEPEDFTSAGTLVGWGLRNSVGLREHPVTGGLYSVENSADGVMRAGVDIHIDNPGEELNFHGSLAGADTQLLGRNYGYPDCFALWDTDIPNRGEMKVGSQFALDNNRSIDDAYCAREKVSPRLTFQAHTAPLDIAFERDGATGFVSFHGSWNRVPPVGYKVSSIAFSPTTGEPLAPSDSTTSAVDILSSPDLTRCPGRCFRPVGLALDQQGRLFVSSDSTGEIWVLRRTTTGGDTASATGAGSSTAAGGATGSASGAAVTPTGQGSGGVRGVGAGVGMWWAAVLVGIFTWWS